MPKLTVTVKAPIAESFRVAAVRGLFDVPKRAAVEKRWQVDIPIESFDWTIGLIVGPSGSGKSTIAGAAFKDAHLHEGYAWPETAAIVDAFPADLEAKEITAALSSVGLSSPPDWLKRYSHLSNGQRFRCELARLMCDTHETVVFDEFSSVVDRTVARVSSAALAKALRQRGRPRLIALSCHYDIVDWLDPDWVYDVGSGEFARRLLRRRPPIALEVHRCGPEAWELFKDHHYLTADLARTAHCYVGLAEGRPAAFTAVLSFPHPYKPCWREHRTVCLPDFQGVGIGNAMSELIASAYASSGKAYRSVTSHPAMIAHRAHSPNWRMVRRIGHIKASNHGGIERRRKIKTSVGRITAAFEYQGRPLDLATAQAFLGLTFAGGDADARITQALTGHDWITTRVVAGRAGLTPKRTGAILRRMLGERRVTMRTARGAGRRVWALACA